MDITYLGHSSFKLKGKTGSLVTDPYDPKMLGLKFPKTEANIVTISHAHLDHSHLDNIEEGKVVFDGPGEYEASGISVIGIGSYHDDEKGAKRGINTIFIIEMDNIRLAHFGDLGHTLSQSVIDAIGPIDVAFIPVGGVYTIDSKQAMEVIKAVSPKIIVPMHYLVAGMDSKTFEGLEGVDKFLEQNEIKVEKVSKLVLKQDDLIMDDQRVVVFETK